MHCLVPIEDVSLAADDLGDDVDKITSTLQINLCIELFKKMGNVTKVQIRDSAAFAVLHSWHEQCTKGKQMHSVAADDQGDSSPFKRAFERFHSILIPEDVIDKSKAKDAPDVVLTLARTLKCEVATAQVNMQESDLKELGHL